METDWLETGRAELAGLIARHATGAGAQPTAVPALYFFQAVEPTDWTHSFYEPSLCLVAQGRKVAALGDEERCYDPAHFLLVSVSLPIGARILEATPERPHLGLHINLDPATVAALAVEHPAAQAGRDAPLGISVGELDALLLDALLRLARLVEQPAHIAALAPLIQREIIYLLLVGAEGPRLRAMAAASGPTQRIASAIGVLRRHYAEPLRMADLAREVGMSVSGLHHHFKAVTAMSPLQYQKHVRLQEARRLMLTQDVDAASASFQVGYESPSQFSREYRRMFGAPPRQDVARLRGGA
ncbi:AraC family transcriptional regulator [Chloroflexia bacterium SDU3-3]|nr:AraC family transcriptional regulator [Chloroflexia bacterium SDU3-3]